MATVIDQKKRKQKKALILGGIVGGGALAALLFALFSGDTEAAEPEPQPEPEPAPPPQPKPQPGENWGATPPGLRDVFQKAEDAAGIPGLGRFLAVRAWIAFRAGKPLVDTATAAQIAAENPELGRLLHNQTAAERTKSKAALDRVTLPKNQGGAYDPPWPAPADYAGWSDGSYGLLDLLAGVSAHAGIHNGKYMPLVNEPATVMFRVDVQVYVATYMVYRFVHSQLYPVLVKGDPLNTWSNIQAAMASPAGYIDLAAGKPTPDAAVAATAKANCLARATELGIDLAALEMPFDADKKPPWGWPGAKAFREKFLASLALPPKIGQTKTIAGHEVYLLGPQASGNTLVVGFHGIANDVTQLFELAEAVAPLATVALIQGPQKAGSKWKYFSEPSKGDQTKFAIELTDATTKALAVIDELRATYNSPKVVVLGTSQGGHIAAKLARDGAVDAAVTVAGVLPAALYPAANSGTVVRAFHGQTDTVVPFASGLATVNAFGDAGFDIVFTPQNTGHNLEAMIPAVRPALLSLI